MKAGKGCRLQTNDGKDYLDFVSGIATCALGLANPALIEAVTHQMQQCHHVSNLYYVPAQATLATWLCDNSVADKVFFCNSGAEANEAAIKLARKNAANNGITVRYRIIINCRRCFVLFYFIVITIFGRNPKVLTVNTFFIFLFT